LAGGDRATRRDPIYESIHSGLGVSSRTEQSLGWTYSPPVQPRISSAKDYCSTARFTTVHAPFAPDDLPIQLLHAAKSLGPGRKPSKSDVFCAILSADSALQDSLKSCQKPARTNFALPLLL